jgi:hypothetical protein
LRNIGNVLTVWQIDQKILGYAPHEIIGKPIFTLIPTELHDEEQPIPRLSKAGMPSHSEGWGGLFKDESTD